MSDFLAKDGLKGFKMFTVRERFENFLFIAPIALCLIGAWICWLAFKTPHPTLVTAAQLIRSHPKQGWYSITDNHVDYSKYFRFENDFGYVLRGPHDSAASPVRMLYLTKDMLPTDVKLTSIDGMVSDTESKNYARLATLPLKFDHTVMVIDSRYIPTWRLGLLLIVIGIVLGSLIYPWLARKYKQGSL